MAKCIINTTQLGFVSNLSVLRPIGFEKTSDKDFSYDSPGNNNILKKIATGSQLILPRVVTLLHAC